MTMCEQLAEGCSSQRKAITPPETYTLPCNLYHYTVGRRPTL